MEDLVRELHRPARKNFKRRHVIMKTIDDTWSSDLKDLSSYSKENKGYKFLLVVIDNFSKYTWVAPLKSKNAQDVTKAMENVLREGRIPKNLWVDRGTEYYNSTFKNLMRKHNINLYSTFSSMKSCIAERMIRTVMRKIQMNFQIQRNYNWVDYLPKLISEYNDAKHRTLNMKPSDVTPENAKSVYRRVYSPLKNIESQLYNKKFDVGQKVRISKFKHIFEKGYMPSWTTEIFTVTQVNNTTPVTYLLRDFQDQPIQGSFYNEELAPVKDPELYLIERVIKSRGSKVFVKWYGFSDEFNSWINKSELM